MFNEVRMKINKWFNDPIYEPLLPSRKMVPAPTKAPIGKAKEDLKMSRSRSRKKGSKGSLRMVPRDYKDEQFLKDHSRALHDPSIWKISGKF